MMIIWLASYPRSGNTFFRILLKQIYGINTYSIHNDPLFDKLKGSAEVVGHKKLEMNYEKMATSKQIFFVKTHNLPYDNYPAIYLVRDGRDSLISYAHYIISFQEKSTITNFYNKIKTLFGGDEYAEILKKLILSSNSKYYNNWSENVTQWMNRDGLTFLIKFENLIENPLDSIATAMQALPIENHNFKINASLPSFEELHTQWPDFFRQGKSGGWQTKMSQELQDLFWEHHGIVMNEIGYKR